MNIGFQVGFFVIVESIITILALYFSINFFRNRNFYPMRQLSPLITIFQGTSFYICQLVLLTLIVFVYDDKIVLNKGDETCDCQNFSYNKSFYTFLSFLYVLSRGICFGLTVVKSYRVLIGFQKEKISENSWKYICRNEIILLIIGLLYGLIGFPILTMLTTKLYHFSSLCWLQVYEHNFGGVKYNSWIEEVLTLLILYVINTHRFNDRLLILTILLQYVYIIWFQVNSFLPQGIVQISYWFRSIAMFGSFICWPMYLKKECPNIYITLQNIERFETIISKRFNEFYSDDNYVLEQFLKFLVYRNNEPVVYRDGTKFKNINHWNLFQLFQDLKILREKGKNYHDMYLKIHAQNDFRQIYKNDNYDYDEIYYKMKNYFSFLYQFQYRKTKAYQYLSQLYDSNQVVKYNFEKLNIGLNEAPDITEPQEEQLQEQYK